MPDIPKPRKSQDNHTKRTPLNRVDRNWEEGPDGRHNLLSETHIKIDHDTDTRTTDRVKKRQPDGICQDVFNLHPHVEVEVYVPSKGRKYRGFFHCNMCWREDARRIRQNKWLGIVYWVPTIENYTDWLLMGESHEKNQGQ